MILTLLLRFVAKVCRRVVKKQDLVSVTSCGYCTTTEICTDGDLRLNVGESYEYFNGDTNNNEAYYIGEERGKGLIRGRVEICNGTTQTWGTVCDHQWSNMDASVSCQQAGLSRYGQSCSLPPPL